MASTNKTQNLGLDQWLGSDKPNFHIDINSDFRKIDDFAGSVNEYKNTTDGHLNTLDGNIDSIESVIQSINDKDTLQDERLGKLESTTTSHTQSITKIDGDILEMDGRIDTLSDTTLPALTDRVTAVEAQANLNTNNINAVNTRIDGLYKHVVVRSTSCVINGSTGEDNFLTLNVTANLPQTISLQKLHEIVYTNNGTKYKNVKVVYSGSGDLISQVATTSATLLTSKISKNDIAEQLLADASDEHSGNDKFQTACKYIFVDDTGRAVFDTQLNVIDGSKPLGFSIRVQLGEMATRVDDSLSKYGVGFTLEYDEKIGD